MERPDEALYLALTEDGGGVTRADWGGLTLLALGTGTAVSSVCLLLWNADKSIWYMQGSARLLVLPMAAWMLVRMLPIDGRLKFTASSLVLACANMWAIFFSAGSPSVWPILCAALAVGISATAIPSAAVQLAPDLPKRYLVGGLAVGGLMIATVLVTAGISLMSMVGATGIFFGLALFCAAIAMIQSVGFPPLPPMDSVAPGFQLNVPVRWRGWAYRRVARGCQCRSATLGRGRHLSRFCRKHAFPDRVHGGHFVDGGGTAVFSARALPW